MSHLAEPVLANSRTCHRSAGILPAFFRATTEIKFAGKIPTPHIFS
jgi:hypothetical protein